MNTIPYTQLLNINLCVLPHHAPPPSMRSKLSSAHRSKSRWNAAGIAASVPVERDDIGRTGISSRPAISPKTSPRPCRDVTWRPRSE